MKWNDLNRVDMLNWLYTLCFFFHMIILNVGTHIISLASLYHHGYDTAVAMWEIVG